MRRFAGVLMIVAAAVWWADVWPWAGDSSVSQSSLAEQSLAIVVNLSNPVDNLSMPDLRTIFLGERSHWPNGRRITLIMMEPGQPERNAVLQDICRMTESDLRRRYLQ